MTNEFIRHEPCPNCTSSDAFAVYADGGGYCFSCGHYRRGEGDKDLLLQQTNPTESPFMSLHETESDRPVRYSGSFTRIENRKLSEATCRKFNVRVDVGPVVRFPYYNEERIITGYKERPKKKEFRWVGKNTNHSLFGQHLFGSGKSIVITEGEFDAMSIYQARGDWPVVSLPNGAHGARKALQHQLKYLLNFEEIILCFDQDEAGLKAVQDCVDLFPPDRLFIAAAMGSYKDASEALQAGETEMIRNSYFKKQPYTPQSIINGCDLFELVSRPLHGKDALYPFDQLNEITGGLRLGELVTITSGSGCGKSTVCGEIAVSLIEQGQRIGYIALEESVQRTGLRLMTVAANKPLHLDNNIDPNEFRSAFDRTLNSGRVFLRDGFGSVDPDSLLNDIRYLVKSSEVKWIILDHLSILLSGNDSGDERKMIDVVMTKLRSFVEESGCGMLLISHLRRNQGDKGHEDGAEVSLGQLRGSHSIAQLSDIVIGLKRNISAGDNSTSIKVLKNRHNGNCGPAGELTYSKDTGRLTSAIHFEPTTNYDDF